MFVLVRAVTYAALFIGFVLVYLPSRFLSWSGEAKWRLKIKKNESTQVESRSAFG